MIDDALREELSALLDGALPEERATELRRRMGEDPDLRREYEELARAVESVRALPRSRAPAGLRERLRGSIEGPRARPLFFRLGLLAAAATVLVAAGVALYLRREPPVQFEARDARPPADKAVPAEERFAETPVEQGELSQLRDDQASGAKMKDGAGSDVPAPAEAKEAKKRGARAKEEAEDLLAAVARTRAVPEEDREAYLRQVSALGAEKALEHIRSVFPDEERQLIAEPRDGSTPVLATIVLEDRDEANLVKGIIAAVPKRDAGAAALTIEQEEKDQVSTQVEALPADLSRLARWLALLDLARADASKARVVLGAAKRAEEAHPKPRTAVVRLRFGKPAPEPETPSKEK